MKTLWFYTTIATIIYSIIYGIYEYFVLYYLGYMNSLIGSSTINWTIMYSIFSVILLLICRKKIRISYIVSSFVLFAVLEDIVYWICSSVVYLDSTFPVGNWFDNMFSVFKIFGLGRSIDVYPFFPMFYIYGFGIRIVYDIIIVVTALNFLEKLWTIIVTPVLISVISTSIIFPCERKQPECDVNFNSVLFIFLIQPILMYYIIFIYTIYRKNKDNKEIEPQDVEPHEIELSEIKNNPIYQA